MKTKTDPVSRRQRAHVRASKRPEADLTVAELQRLSALLVCARISARYFARR